MAGNNQRGISRGWKDNRIQPRWKREHHKTSKTSKTCSHCIKSPWTVQFNMTKKLVNYPKFNLSEFMQTQMWSQIPSFWLKSTKLPEKMLLSKTLKLPFQNFTPQFASLKAWNEKKITSIKIYLPEIQIPSFWPLVQEAAFLLPYHRASIRIDDSIRAWKPP